ncbi:MAG TPA: alpha/beta hydrolase domain-containing protein [Casimicrobiaceae bacterium]|nr:alpha/beta hydrolase domain-containing protein [Casimicrobiaceae bacterium]
MLPVCRLLVLVTLAAPVAVAAAGGKAGYVDRLEVTASYDAYGGASFGDVGTYQVVAGIVHGKLDPNNPANAGIVDLTLAPRDASGMVDYSTDFVILRPKSIDNAKRVLFYDVVNRGNKLAAGTFNGAGANLATGQPGNGLLLRLGYTLVWSGWQGNIAQTGHGDAAAVGTSFPVATNPDGSSITGGNRDEIIPDYMGVSPDANGNLLVSLSYPAATLDKSQVLFNWRPTWKTPAGMTFNSPSTPIASSDWSFVNNGTQIQFKMPAGSDLGTIFTFAYEAKDPTVMGIGFAAVRDLITFLKFDQHDAQGNPNPLNDFQHAPCLNGGHGKCHGGGDSNFEVAVMEGISQSGRFTRDFLWRGFNDDTRGHAVFNGMFPIIPGSRKTYTDFRFSQPGRWSKEHEDHWQPGDQFPFAYNVIRDPLTGVSDGVMKKCLETGTCPKIVQLDGGFETFGARDSLVSTDGAGHDLVIPDNVRLYVVPDANHGGGAGVAAIATNPVCVYETSAVVESTFDRALAPVLVDWVGKGIMPPPSQWPSVNAGTLAVPTDQSAVGFPDLTSIGVPYRGDLYNEISVTDYSNAVPVADLSRKYTVLVSKTDADGNDIAGIRVPEIVAPLATYTGWNVRTTNHTSGEGCISSGSTIPFAKTAADRQASGDPRPSLAERYSSKADYVTKVQAAAQALADQRLLLQEDVATYVQSAQAQTLLQ